MVELSPAQVEARRTMHARRTARRRRNKRRRRECRDCIQPAATDRRTGLPMLLCPDHLARDAARKAKKGKGQ